MLRTPRPSLILITDPGPDPDDVKAILVAAILHNQRHLFLRAVIANGGGAPRDRARLARCVLASVGASDVPVGIGSEGIAVAAQPHEYALAGYADETGASLRDGRKLLVDALRQSADKTVRVVLISSLRCFADLCEASPELVRSKVAVVAVQGGLQRCETGVAGSSAGYEPDSSVNNEFDRAAAAAVYAFCFEHGVPMTVTSRHAVPTIPMQLARSFAESTNCSVMRYLADAQFLGLRGLWGRLCAGGLPERCSKLWYFTTFCGVDAETFARLGLEQLGADEDIVARLDGIVKPYDVIALMTALPQTRHLFTRDAVFEYRGCEHLLLLEPAHAISSEPVVTLLREVYCEVVLATKAAKKSASWKEFPLNSQRLARAIAAGNSSGPWRTPMEAGGLGGRRMTHNWELVSAASDPEAAADALVDCTAQPSAAFGDISSAAQLQGGGDRATGLSLDESAELDALKAVVEQHPVQLRSAGGGDLPMLAMRTNLRDALGAEMHDVASPRLHANKVDESGVASLLQTSLQLALSSRVWLVRAVRVVVWCCALATVPLVFSAADPSASYYARIERYEREFCTFILACNLILVSRVRPATRVVARSEAASAGCAAAFVIGFVWLHRVHAVRSDGDLIRAMARAPGDWAFFGPAAESTRALAASSRAALGFGAALSYCVMLLAGWAAAIFALALAALAWHGCHYYYHTPAARRRVAARGSSAGDDDWSAPRALSPAVFKRTMFAWYGCWAALFAAFDVWQTGVIAAFGSARAGELALRAGSFVTNICLLAFCSSRTCQRLVYDAVGACGRSTTRHGALLSLAPLLGVGGENRPPDAAVIAADAKRDFRAIKLDARARGLLLRARRATSDSRLERLRATSRDVTGGLGGYEQLRASASWRSARIVPLRPLPPLAAGIGEGRAQQQWPQQQQQQQQHDVEPGCAGTIRLGSVQRTVQRVSSFLSDPSWRRVRTVDSDGSPDVSVSGRGRKDGYIAAERAERADAYVVHAAADHVIAAELCSWAERFEAEEGRPPTVWLHQLCASRSLAPVELLAHLPCYLARCDRLLLLASPATPLDLTAVTTCYVWRVLGGRPSTVDAVLLASASSERTVAAFDTFHVMHTHLTDGDESERAAATERLRGCVRLASVRAFNVAVRDLLPVVQEAAKKRQTELSPPK